MGNLLSGSSSGSKGTITDVDRAVLALKAQRKKLEDQSRLVGGWAGVGLCAFAWAAIPLLRRR
jgi:hypothetical protein